MQVLRPYLALGTAIVIWGASFLFTQQALLALTPVQLVACRFALGYAVLWLGGRALALPRGAPLERRDWIPLIALTLIEPVLYFAFETWALKLTEPVNVAMIVALSPLTTTLVAQLLLGEKPRPAFYAGLVLSIGGAALVLAPRVAAQLLEGARPGFAIGTGELLAFAACLIVSFYAVLARPLVLRTSSYRVTHFQLGFTALVFGALALGTPGAFSAQGAHSLFAISWTPLTVVSVLGLGIFASAVAFFSLNYAYSRIPVRHVALATNFIPLLTWSLSLLLPAGRFDPIQAAGLLLAFAGLAVSVFADRAIRAAEARGAPPS